MVLKNFLQYATDLLKCVDCQVAGSPSKFAFPFLIAFSETDRVFFARSARPRRTFISLCTDEGPWCQLAIIFCKLSKFLRNGFVFTPLKKPNAARGVRHQFI